MGPGPGLVARVLWLYSTIVLHAPPSVIRCWGCVAGVASVM